MKKRLYLLCLLTLMSEQLQAASSHFSTLAACGLTAAVTFFLTRRFYNQQQTLQTDDNLMSASAVSRISSDPLVEQQAALPVMMPSQTPPPAHIITVNLDCIDDLIKFCEAQSHRQISERYQQLWQKHAEVMNKLYYHLYVTHTTHPAPFTACAQQMHQLIFTFILEASTIQRIQELLLTLEEPVPVPASLPAPTPAAPLASHAFIPHLKKQGPPVKPKPSMRPVSTAVSASSLSSVASVQARRKPVEPPKPSLSHRTAPQSSPSFHAGSAAPSQVRD